MSERSRLVSAILTITFCTFTGGKTLYADDRPSVTLVFKGVATGSGTFYLIVAGYGNGFRDASLPLPAVTPGMSGRELRDAVLTEFGTGLNFGRWELLRISVNGEAAIRVRNVAAVEEQVYPQLILGGNPERLIEPGYPLLFAGLTIEAFSGDPSPGATTGIAPAVSTWGLTIMGLLVLTVGTVGILRRNYTAKAVASI